MEVVNFHNLAKYYENITEILNYNNMPQKPLQQPQRMIIYEHRKTKKVFKTRTKWRNKMELKARSLVAVKRERERISLFNVEFIQLQEYISK